MQKGFAPIIVIIAFLILAGLAGAFYLGKQTHNPTTSQPSPNQSTLSPTDVTKQTDETANWKTYENKDHHFKFLYPTTYSSVGKPTSLSQEDLVALTSFKDSGKNAKIDLYLDQHVFSLEYLKRYAPTGGESFAPLAQEVGSNIFYYYGPGGGGVDYPDQYFFNLYGKTLYILFVGPYTSDKTPPQEAKDLERQILSTFRFTQ